MPIIVILNQILIFKKEAIATEFKPIIHCLHERSTQILIGA